MSLVVNVRSLSGVVLFALAAAFTTAVIIKFIESVGAGMFTVNPNQNYFGLATAFETPLMIFMWFFLGYLLLGYLFLLALRKGIVKI